MTQTIDPQTGELELTEQAIVAGLVSARDAYHRMQALAHDWMRRHAQRSMTNTYHTVRLMEAAPHTLLRDNYLSIEKKGE